MTTTRLKSLLLALCVGGSATIAGAQSIDPIIEVGKERTAAAKASQAKIDRLADETASLLSDYKTVMKQVDGLKVYNARLERQIANQNRRIADIDGSISEAAVIQRQIPPLVGRMLDGLEQFIRQVADKAHGIGNYYLDILWEAEAPAGRIQGGKELILSCYFALGESI